MSLEGIVLLAVFLAAGWPVVRAVRGGGVSRWIRAATVAGALALWGALFWAAKDRSEPAASVDDSGQVDVQAMTRPSKGYVTSDNCRSCHPGHYATWHASYHRTMTTAASENSVKGDFDNAQVEHEGRLYRMTREQDGFWMETDDPDRTYVESGERARVRRRVALTTGSHHMQFYWSSTGKTRQMRMLPLGYNLHDQRWVPALATFIRPPEDEDHHEPGMWNEVCIQCHVTFAQPKVMSSAEVFTEAAEFGISCEACHGPAERHVEVNADMMARYRRRLTGEADDSVVEPTKLASRVDSQVCGQCHSVNRAASRAVWDNYLRQGFAYRPGGEVEPERVFARLSYTNYIQEVLKADPSYVRDHFWADGMVRVAGREYTGLIESPCYQHGDSDRRMSCFSCHEMHQAASDPRPVREWADDQLKHAVMGDQACLQCHEGLRKDITAHTFHAADSSGSRCYNCHMPHTTYGLLKGIRSHQISSPSVGETLSVGRPNACNLCHLDKTLAWTAAHLDSRHGIKSPPMGVDEQEVAASLLWLIKGDAAQRALTAWHFGWKPAREASGEGWMPPFLALLLEDDYDAVRYIAAKALQALQGFAEWRFDYVGAEAARLASRDEAMEIWRGGSGATEGEARLLLQGDGKLDEEAVRLMLLKRDNTPVNLSE